MHFHLGPRLLLLAIIVGVAAAETHPAPTAGPEQSIQAITQALEAGDLAPATAHGRTALERWPENVAVQRAHLACARSWMARGQRVLHDLDDEGQLDADPGDGGLSARICFTTALAATDDIPVGAREPGVVAEQTLIRVTCLHILQQPAQAVQVAASALPVFPDDPLRSQVLYASAQAALDDDQVDVAYRWYAEIILNDPESREARLSRGRMVTDPRLRNRMSVD